MKKPSVVFNLQSAHLSDYDGSFSTLSSVVGKATKFGALAQKEATIMLYMHLYKLKVIGLSKIYIFTSPFYCGCAFGVWE